MRYTANQVQCRLGDLNNHYCLRSRWRRLSAGGPADTRAMEMAATMHNKADRLGRRAASRIVEGYGRPDNVSLDDVASTMHRNMEILLLAFAERSSLSDADLEACRELGRRRAEQGVPFRQVMRAFWEGYQALWDGLSTLAGQRDASFSQTVLECSAYLRKAFDGMVTAVEEGYRDVVESTWGGRSRKAQALLTGLLEYPRNAEQTMRYARSLGVDPQSWFAVAVSSPGNYVQSAESTTVLVEYPDQVVIIMNCSGDPRNAEKLFSQMLERQRFSNVGVGVVRKGLTGAQQGIIDAESAHRLALAFGEAVVHYREHWLSCMALRHRGQLDTLVAPATKVLKNDPEMARTLEAFLVADGNLTATGKALFVHPNTVGYRLKQFAHRTGIDPRLTSGIALVQAQDS